MAHDMLYNLVESLISIGSDLLVSGNEMGSMKMLDAAYHSMRSPNSRNYAAASKALLSGSELLLHEDCSKASASPSSPPDLYEEDECDVGPRILRTPVRYEPCCGDQSTIMLSVIVFNKGLSLQALGKIVEARRCYEYVIEAIRGVQNDLTYVPSTVLIELGMRAHNNVALIYYDDSNEDLAKDFYEAALSFGRQIAPLKQEYALEYASILSNMCRVNWMQGCICGNFHECLEEVLRVRSAFLPHDHVDVAAAHYNVAISEYVRRNSEKAMSHLMQYLQIVSVRSKCLMNDLDPIPALIHILLIQNEEKDDDMSLELVRGLRTLQDKRHDHGRKNLEVASVLNYIGTLLFHKPDLESALIFFREELRIEDELSCSDKELAVSVTCNNIGRIMQELGRYEEATRFYERALKSEYGEIIECTWNKGKITARTANNDAKESASTANLYSTVWYNLGLIQDKLGFQDRAVVSFEMALGLRKAMLGPDHSDVACLLYNIGVLRMERNQLAEATAAFREALQIRSNGVEDQLNDQHVAKTLEKLASLHKARGNIEGALEASVQVLKIQETSPLYEGVSRLQECANTLRSMAELYQAIGNLDAALAVASKSVQNLRAVVEEYIRDENVENCKKNVALEQLVSSMLLLGSLYHEMCEPLQAIAVLQHAAMIVHDTNMVATPSLHALREVTRLLANNHCAPEA